jgi:alkylmercury lyase
MREQAIDIAALAEGLVNVDGLFDRRDGQLALALYRLLAEGEPVSGERLAERTGRPLSEVADWLRGPRTVLDERGEVVAFQGLSLRSREHVLELDGRTLYAWCAADTLLITDLLDGPVRVRSTDPITGKNLSLSVEDGRVRAVEPSTAVLSMVRPADGIVGEDVVPVGCGPINFFGSEESGRAFTERAEGTFLLTIEDGLELGRLINRELFGAALEERGG